MRASESEMRAIDEYMKPHERNLSTLFDVAEGLYWYCVDYHFGQNSTLYRIQCEIDFHPGANARGPEPDSFAQIIYDDLDAELLDAETLYEWFKREWPRAKARENA